MFDRGEYLGLREPSFDSLPMEFVDSIDSTASHFSMHRAVLESLPTTSDFEFPSISQSALSCTAMESAESVYLDRVRARDGQDSGWFVACSDPNHDHDAAETEVRDSLYGIALRKPAVIPFLCLPVGTTVILTSGKKPRLLLHGCEFLPEIDSWLNREIAL